MKKRDDGSQHTTMRFTKADLEILRDLKLATGIGTIIDVIRLSIRNELKRQERKTEKESR